MPRKQVTYSNRPNHRARMVHAQGERQFRTYDTSHIRPKQSKAPVIIAGIVFVLLVVGIIFGVTSFLKGCSAQPEAVDGSQVVVQADLQAEIPQGATAADVAQKLADAGIVPDAQQFLARAQELGMDSQFQAGAYSFAAGTSLDGVIKAIATGDLGGSGLTIPEGFTVKQVAAAVEDATGGQVKAKAFIKQAKASKYQKDYPFVKGAFDNSLEGFLFPKTYQLTDGATADSIIRQMLDQYKAEMGKIDMSGVESLSQADGSAYSEYDVLIVASMIEREAALDEERPLVASVIYNRLAEDMPLGIDATTAYVYGTDFTVDQLHEEGPFNTYDQTGLPAGPICSPGIASLMAAANPDSTDFLYYVAKGDGSGAHTFAKTYDEHQENIANA